MKANNGKGNIPERDLWETEQSFWDILNDQYNFEFDCCANKENSKCESFSDDFLKWDEVLRICWMNPPFSNSIKMFEHFFKVVKKGLAIYRCDYMETKVYLDFILKKADWIFIPNKRIIYEGLEGNSARFPSALIGFNVDPPKSLDGTLLRIIGD